MPNAAQPLRDEHADPAEPDDADGLLVELDAGVLRLRFHSPLLAARRAPGATCRAAASISATASSAARDDVGGRRVDDHHAGLGRGPDVDVVEADAGAGDDLEPRRRGQRLGVDLGGASGPGSRRRRRSPGAARRGRRRCSAGSRSPGPSASTVAGLSSSAMSTTGLLTGRSSRVAVGVGRRPRPVRERPEREAAHDAVLLGDATRWLGAGPAATTGERPERRAVVG